MPFVLFSAEGEPIASGAAPEFGHVAPDERVEFVADGSTWDEADRLKARVREDERSRKAECRSRRSLRTKELGNRLIFAVTKEWRFAAHRNGTDVVAYPADKRVGSTAGLRGKRKRKVTQLQALGDRGEWCGVRASGLLVALDEWRDAGCPRRAWKHLEWPTDLRRC